MLLKRLLEEKESKYKGGLYHKLQVLFAYNSNHIEGSRLTEEQTRHIFETNTLGFDQGGTVNIDDIIEAKNHFKALDFILDHVNEPLTEDFIKLLHRRLKEGTSDAEKSWFRVGDYKIYPNEVGGIETTPPEKVEDEINALFEAYNSSSSPHSLEELLDFHVSFERIHPFQDGNGRVGRLLLFKESLRNGIVPFIITDELKYFYYRGLSEWGVQNGYLMDTCLTAQDTFKKYMAYFRIE